MALYTCPICQKTVKNLREHTARMHKTPAPGESPAPAANPPESPPVKAEKFEITPPAPKAKTTYHCVDCGATVNRGQSPCPECGAELDWSGI